MLHQAVYWQLIVANPAERVQPPKERKTKRKSYDDDRLFVQSDGKPMHPSTISKWFVKYVGQIELTVINFHGLRHTNASLLVAQNVHISVVSARLGHAQISTTLDFYVHPLLSHNRKAGYILEKGL